MEASPLLSLPHGPQLSGQTGKRGSEAEQPRALGPGDSRPGPPGRRPGEGVTLTRQAQGGTRALSAEKRAAAASATRLLRLAVSREPCSQSKLRVWLSTTWKAPPPPSLPTAHGEGLALEMLIPAPQVHEDRQAPARPSGHRGLVASDNCCSGVQVSANKDPLTFLTGRMREWRPQAQCVMPAGSSSTP